jgi:hypothetical protein
VRPAPSLLSIGEMAGHVAYWQTGRLAGEPEGESHHPNLATLPIKSLLIDRRFGYYPGIIEEAPTDEQKAMTAEQVWKELKRVHEEGVAAFRARNIDLDVKMEGWSVGPTYRDVLRYAIFHVSYHTGQIYSARFLFGETPPDN